MNTVLLGLYVKFENLVNREEGQDVVEYALVIALITLAAIASMRIMDTSVSTEFSVIESLFASAV
jgi:pilus assembly protein Flp/PilA